jgi:hypothetical protein
MKIHSINPLNFSFIPQLAVQKTQPSSPVQSNSNTQISEISTGVPEGPLTLDEKKEVQALHAQDREVRSHEASHIAAAGPYATGSPTFKYERGPDGKLYAVEGEVQIDVSEVPNDPEATIQKAQTVRRAANAPAKPSAQDRRVALEATILEAQARQEQMQERIEEFNKGKEGIKTIGVILDTIV